jgi:hypothetical protein
MLLLHAFARARAKDRLDWLGYIAPTQGDAGHSLPSKSSLPSAMRLPARPVHRWLRFTAKPGATETVFA